MNRTFVIPGPETVLWWGVNVPLLAAVLGISGVLLGYWMAPVIGTPLPINRQVPVLIGGVLLVITVAMAAGQKPALVLSWGFGIGFAGITIFRTMGEHTTAGFKAIGELLLAKLRAGDRGAADTTEDNAP